MEGGGNWRKRENAGREREGLGREKESKSPVYQQLCISCEPNEGILSS